MCTLPASIKSSPEIAVAASAQGGSRWSSRTGPDSLQIKPHSLSLFETLSKRRLFNRAEKLDKAWAAKEIKIVVAGGRRKEREGKKNEGQRVFNPPTGANPGTESIYWLTSLRGAPGYVQLVATNAEDAKTDLPESSLTKFAWERDERVSVLSGTCVTASVIGLLAEFTKRPFSATIAKRNP